MWLAFVEDGVPVGDVVVLFLEEGVWGVVEGEACDFVAGAVEFAAAFAGVVFAGDFHDDVHAVGDFAEYGVAVVEEGGGDVGDEELGAVGAWAGVGHGEDARFVVAEGGVEFVGEFVAWAAAAGFGWVSALEHEAVDDAVEGDVVVVAAFAEVEEVGGGDGCVFGEDGGVDVASGSVEGDADVVSHSGGRMVENGGGGKGKGGGGGGS